MHLMLNLGHAAVLPSIPPPLGRSAWVALFAIGRVPADELMAVF